MKKWLIIGAVALIVSVYGCESAAVRQQIQQAQDQATVEKAKAKTEAAVAAEKIKADQVKKDAAAEANPAKHPADYQNVIVKKSEKPLWFMVTVGVVGFLISIGLCFVSWLHWLTKITVPAFGAVAFLSYFGLLLLPVAPYLADIGLGLLFVLLMFEWFRERKAIETYVETKLGLQPPKPTTSSTVVPPAPPAPPTGPTPAH